MTGLLIEGGIAAAAIALGAYLRWAVLPVLAAYRIGTEMGRMLGAKERLGLEAALHPVK